MHQEINSPDFSESYACVFRPVKSSMHTFISIFHLSSWKSLSTCANERKRSSRQTFFDRPHVCLFGDNVLITERYD